jgi:hypothetical protein
VETADKRWMPNKELQIRRTMNLILFGESTATRARTLLPALKMISVLPLRLNSLKSGCCRQSMHIPSIWRIT